MKLFLLSLRPMAVLTIPMVLLLGQLGLWYQARPLRVGEESIVTVQVKDDSIEALNSISMGPLDGSAVVAGPVRVPTKSMVCWNVKPTRDGRHVLEFRVGETSFEKELVAGSGFQATSLRRPAWRASDALVHPRESPFPPDSVVQSIDVTYPDRDSWTSGTNHWVVYWFVIAMIAALVAKPLLKVNL